MQIMPATWAELRARQRLGSDPYDPHDNIMAGAAYMRTLLDRYGSPGLLAAYNAGPGRYEASLNGRPLPAETRAYVAAIAPAIDGTDATSPVMVAMAAPPDWTRAPLFVVQPERGPVTNLCRQTASPNDARAAARVRDISAIAPQSTGLFVARSAHGRSAMTASRPFRRISGSSVLWRAQGVEAGNTTGRWRDKRPRGAASVGRCFSAGYGAISRGAEDSRTSRQPRLCMHFRDLARCAGLGHERRGRLPHPARPHPLDQRAARQALHRPGARRRAEGRRPRLAFRPDQPWQPLDLRPRPAAVCRPTGSSPAARAAP